VEGVVGRPLDPTRFRANVFFDGAEPWAEKNWLGRNLRIGEARLKVFAETNRCEATNVNPETAERDTAIPPTLLRTYGHTAVGVYATVATGGEIRPGGRIEILD
jgi:uncharacterized protein YcbX